MIDLVRYINKLDKEIEANNDPAYRVGYQRSLQKVLYFINTGQEER